MRVRSRSRRVLTCSTSASTLVCSAVRSSTGSARRGPGRRGRGGSSSAPRGRRARAGCRAGSAAGRRASRAPGGRAASAGRRGRLSGSAPRSRQVTARNVQASVHSVLTRVSTVSRAAASRASTCGSQVHSAAQWATSTSAGPPFSTNSVAGWWRRSLVTNTSTPLPSASPEQEVARSPGHGHAAYGAVRVAGDQDAAGGLRQRRRDVLRRSRRSVVGSTSPTRPAPVARGAPVGERDDVPGGRLVGVRDEHRRDHLGATAAVEHHLDRAPRRRPRGRRPRPIVRAGALQRPEPALARRR